MTITAAFIVEIDRVCEPAGALVRQGGTRIARARASRSPRSCRVPWRGRSCEIHGITPPYRGASRGMPRTCRASVRPRSVASSTAASPASAWAGRLEDRQRVARRWPVGLLRCFEHPRTTEFRPSRWTSLPSLRSVGKRGHGHRCSRAAAARESSHVAKATGGSTRRMRSRRRDTATGILPDGSSARCSPHRARAWRSIAARALPRLAVAPVSSEPSRKVASPNANALWLCSPERTRMRQLLGPLREPSRGELLERCASRRPSLRRRLLPLVQL